MGSYMASMRRHDSNEERQVIRGAMEPMLKQQPIRGTHVDSFERERDIT